MPNSICESWSVILLSAFWQVVYYTCTSNYILIAHVQRSCTQDSTIINKIIECKNIGTVPFCSCAHVYILHDVPIKNPENVNDQSS